MLYDFALTPTPAVARHLLHAARFCKLACDPMLYQLAQQDLVPPARLVKPGWPPLDPLQRGAIQFVLDCDARAVLPDTTETAAAMLALMIGWLGGHQPILVVSRQPASWRQRITRLFPGASPTNADGDDDEATPIAVVHDWPRATKLVLHDEAYRNGTLILDERELFTQPTPQVIALAQQCQHTMILAGAPPPPRATSTPHGETDDDAANLERHTRGRARRRHRTGQPSAAAPVRWDAGAEEPLTQIWQGWLRLAGILHPDMPSLGYTTSRDLLTALSPLTLWRRRDHRALAGFWSIFSAADMAGWAEPQTWARAAADPSDAIGGDPQA